MDTTVDPLDTESDEARRSALAALRGWATRRDQLPARRADLLAAAWWSGNRNVAELARSADVSRDTVYDDLRARGIDPTDRRTAPQSPPRYAPLAPAAVDELADLAGSVVAPAMLTQEPGPLPQTAWALAAGLARIAVLCDDDFPAWAREEAAQDLVARLRTALRHAHEAAADGWSDRQLARRTREHRLDTLEYQALAGATSLTLVLPGGEQATVHIESGRRSKDGEEWTVLRSDSRLDDRGLSGAEHLAVTDALETLAEILTPHLLVGDDSGEVDQDTHPVTGAPRRAANGAA
jgi:hypothetical protein